MNYVITILLSIAILIASTVYAISNRYTTFTNGDGGVYVIDNWEFKDRRIIERGKSGNWYEMDIIKGGKEIMEYEESLKQAAQEENNNQMEVDHQPEI